eukprot:3923685-Prymnesium_polylepis.2
MSSRSGRWSECPSCTAERIVSSPSSRLCVAPSAAASLAGAATQDVAGGTARAGGPRAGVCTQCGTENAESYCSLTYSCAGY